MWRRFAIGLPAQASQASTTPASQTSRRERKKGRPVPDWTERIESAQLPDAIDGLRKAVESAQKRAEGAGEDHVPVRRAAAAADLVETLLASESSDVVGQGVLTDLAERLEGLRAPLERWGGGARGQKALNEVSAQVDELLDQLRVFPQPAPADAASAAWAVVKKVRGAGTRASNVFDEELERVGAEVEALEQRIGEADTDQHQHIDKARAELAERLDELKSEIDRIGDEITATTERFEERESTATKQRAKDFDDAEGDRSEAFRSLQKQREEEWTQQSDAFDERLEAKLAALSEATDGEVARIEELRAYVEELSGIIGDAGLAGEYSHQATNQQMAADRWRLVTIALLLGAVGWALLAVFFGGLDTPDTSVYLGRLPIAILLAALAAYTGRQSTLHRRREDAYRQRQMQLQALRLYLAPLDDTQQAAVTMQLSPHFFGDGLDHNGNGARQHPPDVETLTQLLAQTARSNNGADEAAPVGRSTDPDSDDTASVGETAEPDDE